MKKFNSGIEDHLVSFSFRIDSSITNMSLVKLSGEMEDARGASVWPKYGHDRCSSHNHRFVWLRVEADNPTSCTIIIPQLIFDSVRPSSIFSKLFAKYVEIEFTLLMDWQFDR